MIRALAEVLSLTSSGVAEQIELTVVRRKDEQHR
jgi:hypothetical protein